MAQAVGTSQTLRRTRGRTVRVIHRDDRQSSRSRERVSEEGLDQQDGAAEQIESAGARVPCAECRAEVTAPCRGRWQAMRMGQQGRRRRVHAGTEASEALSRKGMINTGTAVICAQQPRTGCRCGRAAATMKVRRCLDDTVAVGLSAQHVSGESQRAREQVAGQPERGQQGAAASVIKDCHSRESRRATMDVQGALPVIATRRAVVAIGVGARSPRNDEQILVRQLGDQQDPRADVGPERGRYREGEGGQPEPS